VYVVASSDRIMFYIRLRPCPMRKPRRGVKHGLCSCLLLLNPTTRSRSERLNAVLASHHM
jgi:hypothetical protein